MKNKFNDRITIQKEYAKGKKEFEQRIKEQALTDALNKLDTKILLKKEWSNGMWTGAAVTFIIMIIYMTWLR